MMTFLACFFLPEKQDAVSEEVVENRILDTQFSQCPNGIGQVLEWAERLQKKAKMIQPVLEKQSQKV